MDILFCTLSAQDTASHSCKNAIIKADSWSEEEKVPVSLADSLPGCSDGPSPKAMRLDKKLSEEMSTTLYQAADFQTSHKENARRKNLGLSKQLCVYYKIHCLTRNCIILYTHV